jgi:hypothetical protein
VKPKERPRLDSEAIPNFLELRHGEVHRILLLRHWVNKGERKAGDLLWDPRHIMESNFT